MQIYLTNSDKVAQVDLEDFDRVFKLKWYLDTQGYARSTIVTKTQVLTKRGLLEHRVVENIKLHQFVKRNDSGWSFADGDRLNCTRANLVEYQNTGRPGKNKLGKGIYPSGKKFSAYLTTPKKYLGQFDTVALAQEAIDNANRTE